MFWRLTTVADDFGRFDANPMALTSNCFSVMLDKIKPKDCAKWLTELVECGLVRVYCAGDRTIGELATFHIHQGLPRAQKSKFPDPVENIDDRNCAQMSANVPAVVVVHEHEVVHDKTLSPSDDGKSESGTKTGSLGHRPKVAKSTSRTEWLAKFDEFWAVVRRKKVKTEARKAWKKLCPPQEHLQDLAGKIIAAAAAYYSSGEVKYLQYPHRWLKGERWEDETEVQDGTYRRSHNKASKQATDYGQAIRERADVSAVPAADDGLDLPEVRGKNPSG